MILRNKFYVNLNFIRLISRSKYIFPELRKEDLDEQFVHGSGPGGSCVNKAHNCVLLKHIPTGVFVRVHESRLVDENRKIARDLLQERVDLHLNGENSFLALKEKERRDKATKSGSKRRKQREKSAEFRNLAKTLEAEEEKDTNSKDVRPWRNK